MNILTAVVGVLVMGLGAFTVLGMFVAAVISIVTVSREKRAAKKEGKEA